MHVLLLILSLLPSQKDEASVAMVLKVEGEVTVTSGDMKPRKMWVMDLLRPNDQIKVPEGGEVTLLFLEDGHREILAAGKMATIGAKGCSPKEAVAKKEPGKLSNSMLKNLRGDIRAGRIGGVILRRGDERNPLPTITPLPDSNVATNRPTLSWPAVKDAESYVVELYTGPDTKDLSRVLRGETKTNMFTLPKDKTLQPVLHRWTVIARLKGDKRRTVVGIKEGTFLLALPRTVRQLKALKPLTESKDPADLLIAASAYEMKAASNEALRLYEQASKLLPKDARIQEILARYYEAGGRPDLAKAAKGKAEKLRKSSKEK